MSTLPAFVPFPSSGDTENIIATLGGNRTRRNALIGGQSASYIDGYTSDSADDTFNAGTNGPSRPLLLRIPPSECQSPPRITILTNPARTRARPQPPTQDSHSPSACQWPPRFTIFSPPVRTRPLPSIQKTLSSSVHQLAPRFTILNNPARAPPPPSAQNTQNSQDASAASPAPKPAVPLKSILKVSRPTRVLQGGGAASAAPKQAFPTRASAPASAPDLGEPGDAAKGERKQPPTIIIHEPVSWDVWTDVHRPGTSKGGMLGVPKVNVRGKLRERDIARYYPNERDAEQIARRLRSMARSGSRLAASRRRERTRQRRQTTPTATPAPAPAPAPTSSSLATPITGASHAPERSSLAATACTPHAMPSGFMIAVASYFPPPPPSYRWRFPLRPSSRGDDVAAAPVPLPDAQVL
ncbi:hypothetical protein BJV74DRAFT_909781 [Russula compacta]|nr:hypothetical protein BJV74DRAFT_909781 [Russula compacta]